MTNKQLKVVENVEVVIRDDVDPPEVVRVFPNKTLAERYTHDHPGEYRTTTKHIDRTYTYDETADLSVPKTVYIISADTWNEENRRGSSKYHYLPTCQHLDQSEVDAVERDLDQMRRTRKTPCKTCFPEEILEMMKPDI